MTAKPITPDEVEELRRTWKYNAELLRVLDALAAAEARAQAAEAMLCPRQGCERAEAAEAEVARLRYPPCPVCGAQGPNVTGCYCDHPQYTAGYRAGVEAAAVALERHWCMDRAYVLGAVRALAPTAGAAPGQAYTRTAEEWANRHLDEGTHDAEWTRLRDDFAAATHAAYLHAAEVVQTRARQMAAPLTGEVIADELRALAAKGDAT
jgi:hypothetical protein